MLALIIVSPTAWQLVGFVLMPLYWEGNQYITEHTLEFNLLKGTLRIWESFPERDCSMENSCIVILGIWSGHQ